MSEVLILGGGLQGLSCGASLKAAGHIVDVISSDLQIRRSRFFRKVLTDGVMSSAEALVEYLSRGDRYDVIIPMGDNNTALLSRNRQLIEAAKKDNCRCACPDVERLSVVEDKHLFMVFCQKNGVPHPATTSLDSDNLSSVARQIGFPAMIKPDFSVGARGVTRVDSLGQLQTSFPAIRETYGHCTLQEYIDNPDYYFNVMMYRDSCGSILAYAIIKIVRMYPVSAGSSACCVTVENDDLRRICADCLEKLNWVGMADFDVLQRRDNGQYKIIELNPRVPASLRAAAVSGVNFPDIIVRDALGLPVPPQHYCPGKTLRYMGLDLMWLLHAHRKSPHAPNWLRFVGKDIYYQDIYSNDPSTWWSWLAEGVAKIGKRNIRLR